MSIRVKGLPAGVVAEAASSSYMDATRSDLAVPLYQSERYLPQTERVAIVLLVDPDAPLTPQPVLLQVEFQPYVDGKPGKSLLANEIPIMVVDNPSPSNEGADKEES